MHARTHATCLSVRYAQKENEVTRINYLFIVRSFVRVNENIITRFYTYILLHTYIILCFTYTCFKVTIFDYIALVEKEI